MNHWLLRWFVFASTMGAVAWLLPGIHMGGGPHGVWTALVASAALGLVNVVVKPILVLFSCPLILMTFGLYLFVINAAMLLLASSLSRALGFSFYVDGWGSAILGSILMSILNAIFASFVGDKSEEESQ